MANGVKVPSGGIQRPGLESQLCPTGLHEASVSWPIQRAQRIPSVCLWHLGGLQETVSPNLRHSPPKSPGWGLARGSQMHTAALDASATTKGVKTVNSSRIQSPPDSGNTFAPPAKVNSLCQRTIHSQTWGTPPMQTSTCNDVLHLNYEALRITVAINFKPGCNYPL